MLSTSDLAAGIFSELPGPWTIASSNARMPVR